VHHPGRRRNSGRANQFKDPSEIPQPEFKKASLPKQIQIDFKAAGIAVPEKIPPQQRTRMDNPGIFWAIGNPIRNEEDAAALLSHIRKSG